MPLFFGFLGVNGTDGDDVMHADFVFTPDYFGLGEDHLLLRNSLSGGSGNDTLYGLSFPLTLPGGTLFPSDIGPDPFFATRLYGGGGDDTLHGGNAADWLSDGEVAETSSDDHFYGNEGNDYFRLEYGNNWAEGGAGDDNIIFSGDGTDTMFGGDGADMFWQDGIGSGTAHIDGNDGIDTLTATSLAPLTWTNLEVLDTANVGFGLRIDGTIEQFMSFSTIVDSRGVFTPTLQLTGTGGVLDLSAKSPTVAEGMAVYSQWLLSSVTLVGTIAGDALFGTLFDDVLKGGAGADFLYGEEGDDILDGGNGSDWMYGGEGVDTASYASSDRRVTVDLATETGSQGATGDHFTSIENVIGSIFNDTIMGNNQDNLLNGGEGADRLVGGTGDDTYYVDQSGDHVVEATGGGVDTIFSTTSYTLRSGQEVEVISVAAGPAYSLLAINLTGNEFDNRIVGNDAANRLDGGSGSDTLIGGAGIDQLIGRSGNDSYYVDNAADKIYEAAGEGTDTVYASVSYALRAAQEIEHLSVDPGEAYANVAIDLTGNEFANTLTGNAAANKLNGMGGADLMVGGKGDDTYYVDHNGDVVMEGAAAGEDTVRATISYTLTGNVENLILSGSAGINGVGNDLGNDLIGNASHNILDGGLGRDVLVGGGGGDTFRFSTSLGPNNIDRIAVFDHAGDTFQLDDAIFTSLSTGGLAAEAFRLGSMATDADDRILYDAGTKSLYYDADGNGALSAVKFGTIVNLTGTIDHTDFFVI